MSKLLNNNKGLSLIELIVVIAIMAVMIGGIGFSISMLSGAEAKQAVQKLNAQLNDVKTGTMTKAGEVLIFRYITVADSNKDARAKDGIDKSGYYADKCVYTIMNNAPGSDIKTAYDDKHEYSFVGSKKVKITFYYGGGKKYEMDGTDDSKAVKLEFNRRTGAFEDMCIGSVSTTDVFSETNSNLGDIEKVTFECGLRTYTLNINAKTGKYSIE